MEAIKKLWEETVRDGDLDKAQAEARGVAQITSAEKQLHASRIHLIQISFRAEVIAAGKHYV